MLFFYEGEFLEVFRENCYPSVLTFCSNNLEVLQAATKAGGTMAEPVELVNQNHQWALHLPDNASLEILRGVRGSEIEKIDRITGEPVAYAYDYILESEANKTEGTRFGDYGYCWPEEIQSTREGLYSREDPVDGEVIFVPIWTLPDELTGAPRQSIDFEVDEEDE